jgi:copper transporter 1
LPSSLTPAHCASLHQSTPLNLPLTNQLSPPNPHRNTQIIDTCIVFPSWHVRTHFQFLFSFLAIVALGVLYEWLRAFARNVDRRVARGIVKGAKGKAATTAANATASSGRVSPTANESGEEDGLLTGGRVFKGAL